jgi:hypothetical protein
MQTQIRPVNAPAPTSKALFLERLLPLAKLHRDREESINKLRQLMIDYPKQNLKLVIEKLNPFDASQIENIRRAVVNRQIKEYQGFRLGDTVRYIGSTYKKLGSTPLTIVEFDLPSKRFDLLDTKLHVLDTKFDLMGDEFDLTEEESDSDSLIAVCIRTKSGTYAPGFDLSEIERV